MKNGDENTCLTEKLRGGKKKKESSTGITQYIAGIEQAPNTTVLQQHVSENLKFWCW